MDYEKAAKEIHAHLQPYFNEALAALKQGDDNPANIYSCATLSCVAALIVVAQDKEKRADALDAAIAFLTSKLRCSALSRYRGSRMK